MSIIKRLPRRYSFIDAGFFLAYYHARSHGNTDYVSERLLDFKDNVEPITSKWVEIAEQELKGSISVDLTLRVLASDETTTTGGTSMDKLGRLLQTRQGILYLPNCLIKNRQTRPLKSLPKTERQSELAGVYDFSAPHGINNNPLRILLLDDVLTTGTTIKEIKRAISEEVSNFKLILFVMGKTYDSWYDEDSNNTELQSLLKISIAHNQSIRDTGKAYTLEEKRVSHKNAYQRWTEEDDNHLKELFRDGVDFKGLAYIFSRNEGAIRARLFKLGLIDKYTV
jgi:hypothetical protein